MPMTDQDDGSQNTGREPDNCRSHYALMHEVPALVVVVLLLWWVREQGMDAQSLSERVQVLVAPAPDTRGAGGWAAE
jgi:hypothetical protein